MLCRKVPIVIAILVAVTQELDPILKRAETEHIVRQQHLDFHEGTLAGQPVALLALGVGKECARIAAEITIRCYRPDLIICAGFAGGLQPEVKEGDIVVGTDVLDLAEDHGNSIRTRSTHSILQPGEIDITSSPYRVHFGKVLTTDEMVIKAANKQRYGKATGALTCDMETSAVAKVALEQKTPMLVVRAVSDSCKTNLPSEFNDFFIVGQLKRRRILYACAHRPHLVLDLARIGLRARRAGRNLAGFLASTLPVLRLPSFAERNSK
jgi:adenosylhomocysteine nucleosidase